MRPRSTVVLALLLSLAACRPRTGAEPRELPPLIPLPASFSFARGAWTPGAGAIALLADPVTASHDALRAAGVVVTIANGAAPESYRLQVTPKGVTVAAGDSAGAFYGLQTLRQMVEAGPSVRAIHVEDAPRFRYRGMHLDAARHFMPAAFVKRYIDLMSRHKLNTFHWHLTDDQGWRIEIRKYPLLTEVGGCRRETMVGKNFTPYVGDGIPHCGFYTQDEIRDVVDYARQRHVTIIPEIEMPGHAKAALAAYPRFACTPGPFEVRTTWGVDEDIFCPGDETFSFIDDVLAEVTQLFPGRYVHIGGDEVPKKRWRESALAQEVMRRENLAGPDSLQSWFIRRVERMLVARGRRLIGWDEILEGGLAPEATVMSWRGTAGGIAAAREGHDVIMSPGSHLYFDAYQGDPKTEPLAIGGFLPLAHVYEFEPVPDSLTPAQARHILGAQANVWSEYLTSPAAVEYMAWPRALALAEVVWSPREARSWTSFSARLPHALASLDRLGVGYRLPDVSGLDGDRLTLSSTVRVTLGTAIPNGRIHYTTDGSDPTTSSPLYVAPFTLPVDERGLRITARAVARDGRLSAPRSATYRRTSLVAAVTEPADLRPGLAYTYHELQARRVVALDTARVVRAGVVHEIARRGDERPERYGIRFEGFLRVPDDDLYEFALTSDDGSTLTVAGHLVVDNDDFHGAEEKTGMIALRRGLHPFVLRYAQATGGAELSLRMRRGEGAWHSVPADWMLHVPH